MAWHLLALLAVVAWTGVTTILVLLPLLLCGKLRVIDAEERTGMDVKKIKEPSYHGTGSQSSGCQHKSTADPVPQFKAPSSHMKSPISGRFNTEEPSFEGAVSFPLPSPSVAQPPPSKYSAAELDSGNPPSLLSIIPPEDSMPLDMEEVKLNIAHEFDKNQL